MELLLLNSAIFSQTVFKIADCEHIKSFGEECDILVFKDNNGARDVFIIEPSIASKINKCDTLLNCDKIIVLTTIFKEKGKYLFKDTQVRCYKNDILINDNKVISSVLSIFKSIHVKGLRIKSDKQLYHFGFILIGKQ